MLFSQLIINSLIAGSIYSLLALGFNFIYGPTRFFNLAHGAVSALAGYVVFSLLSDVHLNLILAVLLGIVAAGALGWLIDWTIYRPLRRREASGMVLLVASLGVMTILESGLALCYGSHFRSFGDYVTTTSCQALGGSVTSIQLIIFICALLAALGLHLLLRRTGFGKAVRAITDDVEVARMIGIRTDRVIGQTFLLGSAVGGLAGILVSFDIGLEPTMGMNLLLKAAIASIIGGVGSMPGAVVGGFLLGAAENFGIWRISSEWKEAIAFGLLIIFLLWRPQGIVQRR
jgi:branched-chain amino acid transport system permease protein